MSRREFRLDIKAPVRRHDDPAKYIIYVLWLIGYSERTIAQAMGLRIKQVAGLLARSEYSGRASMTDQERRMLLQELKDIRCEDGPPIDGGKLDRVSWELRPLKETQLRGPLRRRLACRR